MIHASSLILEVYAMQEDNIDNRDFETKKFLSHITFCLSGELLLWLL